MPLRRRLHSLTRTPLWKRRLFSHASQCYNEIRDVFAKIMRDVCYDFEIEPKLQTLEGESFDYRTTWTEDDARLDIKVK